MPPRRAGAPRLIEWTGERCVPWGPDIQVVYEHYHRYLWVQALARDRRVLDLGSGEGFGSALLADVASRVVGIDVDDRTVQHSQLNYAAPNLEFRVASATDLADLADDSFDVVVAFELIEHLTEQEDVMREVARLLGRDGLLVMSTPDRLAYSDATGQVNPFHERELTQDEFRRLLGTQFANSALFAQRAATGSRIEALDQGLAGSHFDVQIERLGDEWRVGGPVSPLYLIAVASNSRLPALPAGSSLSDFGMELLRDAERAHARTLVELDSARRSAEAIREERDRVVAELLERGRELDDARREAADALASLVRTEDSIGWRLVRALRWRFYKVVGGPQSLIGRAFRSILRLVGRAVKAQLPAPPAWTPLSLPSSPAPEVSIVIPVHNGAELTERCLRAILHATEGPPYEVVIVDDCADPDTRALLDAVEGARVIINEQNLGYLLSVNRGAAAARGRHIVLLNNDTEPQPGWLEAMVERAQSAEDVGIVAVKLVYPDGALQEAGGIVWREGVAWNFGRGREASAPEYNYVREVDYGSAAALLVRTEVWQALGGFDERYAPGYFEDTDLCFAARAHGWRVMYEPKAVVVHAEGGAMGTDPAAGGKRHQELNQPKFADKWSEALRHQPSNPSWERAHLASDRRRGPQVLVVDHRVPTPDRDSGSLRMWRVLEGLHELGCRVIFLADDQHPLQPYTSRLQGMGVEVLAGSVTIPERIAGLGPGLELALISRPYVAPRYMHLVREYAPQALLAYDTVDLHFLREERRARHLLGMHPRLAQGYRELELALARAADVTVVVSEEEREHLAAELPDVPIAVVPNANEIAIDVPGPESRSDLLFVGGFEHLPNIDAAVHMARDVMPRIWRSLPDVTLTIVGSKAPPEVTSLASQGIAVRGWVEDLDELLRSHLIMVAPLRYGAGMKGKVTQSLAAGLPIVTTSIGAEGLEVVDGRELLIADDPDAFAERIVSLHDDPQTWLTLSRHGQSLAERICSPEVQRRALRGLLDRARGSAVELIPSAGQ